MKKVKKIIITTLIILILLIAVLGILFYMYLHTTTGIIVEVNDNSLWVTGTGQVSGLFSVGFANDGNIGFKQGQEILIYFNGYIMQTYPAQLGKARKIIVLKEKSEKEIPKEDLKYCYSSETKVSQYINEITPTSLTITITDTNEMPYEYYTDYKIYKEEINENYSEEEYWIQGNEGNSTPAYVRLRTPIYN